MTHTSHIGQTFTNSSGELLKAVADNDVNGSPAVDAVRWVKSRQAWSKSPATFVLSSLTPTGDPSA